MRIKSLVTVAVVMLSCVAPAQAQAVKVRFHDGLVTLSAQNAPLRAILAEWARLGGTTIVNGERVAGTPLTLELSGVPERQAIDILLRTVSGYMAAPRAADKPGASVYDRILILATSTAPRNPPPQPPGFQPRQPPRLPQTVPAPIGLDDVNDPGSDTSADVPERPEPYGRPQVVGLDSDAEEPETDTAPTPANPFGIPAGATSRPGMITPVPVARPQPTTRPGR